MKKSLLFISLAILGFLFQESANAQCATGTLIGASSNMFTLIRNSTNPVAADKNLNTIVYIHRNNAGVFGGSSGNLRFDMSTNGGTSWTNDLGVLNPINSSLGRYPNVAIYNPTNNVNPSNAYLGYMAATINSVTSAWNGVVTGVMRLNLTGQTESYNQPVINPQLIAHSVVKGAPGIFWAIDALYNGVNITGFTIYKGTWNGTNDITWTNNFSVNPPFNLAYNGIPQVGDYNIAFDPTGNIGWFSFLGHVTPGPGNYAFYPVLYKTTNGGNTWTGPFQVDLNTFSCITGNIVAPNVPTANFEHDLTVDVNGNPHILTTVCNGTNLYSVLYGSWHHMYDITMVNGLWSAIDIANVNAGRGTWGIAPNVVSLDMAPQIARNAAGTKIFYSWSDNAGYALGAANLTPNLFSRAYDVPTQKLTQIKDLTSCNVSINGKILFPHLAAEVLEPTGSSFKMAPVYAEFVVPSDPLQTTVFNFIDNATYSNPEFTVSIPSATVSFVQGSNLLICPNTTLALNVANSPGQVLWNNGATVNPISVTNGTISAYTVTAQINCAVASGSISVSNLSVNIAALNASFCPGTTATLSCIGNALGYTWTPSGNSGSVAIVTVSNNPVHFVTASGSNGCTTTNSIAINIHPIPIISVSGKDSVCIGSSTIKTASGASSYVWSNGINTASVSLSPILNTVYTVTGTAVTSCTNTQTVSIVVNPLPTVTAVSSQTAVCLGQSLTLSAAGANTYSWSNNAATQSVILTPSLTGNYTVTGTDINSCSSTATVAVSVNPLPTLTAVSSRSYFCKGEKPVVLSVAGANTYTWSLNNSNASSIQITPNATVTYTIRGLSVQGCESITTLTQEYSLCTGLLTNTDMSNSLEIFPNPNNGEFKVKFNKEIAFDIINSLGQHIMSDKLSKANGYEVSVQGLPAGIYYVISQNEKPIICKKIIIN